jgi:hypothetical protein
LIKDLNVTPETLKQQETIRNALEHISISNDFEIRTPVAQQLRERMIK